MRFYDRQQEIAELQMLDDRAAETALSSQFLRKSMVIPLGFVMKTCIIPLGFSK